MQNYLFSLAPVANPLAEHEQRLQHCFVSMLEQPELQSERDIATTEQANLLNYLQGPERGPEHALRWRTQELISQLRPVAYLFPEELRLRLLNQDNPLRISEATLAPLTVTIKSIQDLLPWASLEPRVRLPLERLKDYYEMAYRELKQGAVEFRSKWLIWKAQLSIPNQGHYLISVEVARQLLCRNEQGETVRRNKAGNHAVLFRDGLVFKPNPPIDGADPIEPGMEHAVVAWHHLLGNAEETAAPTDIIKLRQVPFSTKAGETFLEGGVVQCGLMIQGILLHDMLYLKETIQHWAMSLGQEALEQLLPQLLVETHAINILKDNQRQAALLDYQAQIQVFVKDFVPYEANDDLSEVEQTRRHITHVLTAFCKYSLSFPNWQSMDDVQVLMDKPQQMEMQIYQIERRDGLLALYFAFAYCARYPKLLQEQTLKDVLRWPKSFNTLAALCPNISPKEQMATASNWTHQLNPDNLTAIVLASLLTCPTDGKGDNYLVTFKINEVDYLPYDFKIIGIDNDRALVTHGVPLAGITCQHEHGGKDTPLIYWPDLNCVLLAMPGVLSTHVSQVVLQHILSKTPLEWVESWLTCILHKTQQWEVWQRLKVLVSDDMHIVVDKKTHKRLDIPLQLPPKLLDLLLTRLERMQNLFRELNQDEQTGLTLGRVFFALEPALAHYYEALLGRFGGQTLRAYEHVHNAIKASYNAEIKRTLGQRLQDVVPPLAVLASSPFIFPTATIETLLNVYPVLVKELQPKLVAVGALADYLADSEKAMFALDELTNGQEKETQQALERLDALGQLGAAHFVFDGESEGPNGITLATLLFKAVHRGLVGALRLLLLERARRLNAHIDIQKRDVIGNQALQALVDKEGATLWHTLFTHLHKPPYADNPSKVEQVTALLAEAIGDQINLRDGHGYLPIFSLVRRVPIVFEHTERVLAQLVGLGLDFSLTETIQSRDLKSVIHETPVDFAFRLCMETSRPPLQMVSLLLQYGAGCAVSANLALSFFQQFQQEAAMKEALVLLKQQNRHFAWVHALHTVTGPLDKENVPQGAWIIEGVKSGKRILAPEIVARVQQTQVQAGRPSKRTSNTLPQATGMTAVAQPTEEEVYGHHAVLPLNVDGEQIHLKILPELPGYEKAVCSLYRHFFNYGLPETELFRFPSVHKNQPLAVLFSQTIVGENLRDVLRSKEAAAKLSQLDIARFTELLIMHLLTSPEDGKDDNYQLVSFINKQGQLRYVIVPIDNDHNFIETLRIETNKGTRKTRRVLQIKTIIYCLDAMHWPLDKTVIQTFVDLKIDQVLTCWLTELKETEQATNQLFNHLTERQQLLKNPLYPVVLDMPLAPKKAAMLYDKAQHLQRLLRKQLQLREDYPNKPMFNGLEMLIKLEPVLGHYYNDAFAKADTPQERFHYLTHDLYTIDLQGQNQTLLSGIPLLSNQSMTQSGMLGIDENYSVVHALREFEGTIKSYAQLENVRRDVQAGNIQALNELVLDKHKERIVLGLRLTEMTTKQQQALWAYLTDKKTAVAFEKLHVLGNQNKPMDTLTNDILKKLLIQSPYLRELRLAYCRQLSQATLGELDVLCPNLMRLSLAYLSGLERLDKTKKQLGGIGSITHELLLLENLQALELIGLSVLKRLLITLPNIKSIIIQQCLQLGENHVDELLAHIDKLDFLLIEGACLPLLSYGNHISRLRQWRPETVEFCVKAGLLLRDGAFYLNPTLPIHEQDKAKLITLCPPHITTIKLSEMLNLTLLEACYSQRHLAALHLTEPHYQVDSGSMRAKLFKQFSCLILEKLVVVQWPQTLGPDELEVIESLLAEHVRLLAPDFHFKEAIQKTHPHQWWWSREPKALEPLKIALSILLPDKNMAPITTLEVDQLQHVQPQELQSFFEQCPAIILSEWLSSSASSHLFLTLENLILFLQQPCLRKVVFHKSERQNYVLSFANLHRVLFNISEELDEYRLQLIVTQPITPINRLAWEAQWQTLLQYLRLQTVVKTEWRPSQRAWEVKTDERHFDTVLKLLQKIACIFDDPRAKDDFTMLAPTLRHFIEDLNLLSNGKAMFSFDVVDGKFFIKFNPQQLFHPSLMARMCLSEFACCLEYELHSAHTLAPDGSLEVHFIDEGLFIVPANKEHNTILTHLLRDNGFAQVKINETEREILLSKLTQSIQDSIPKQDLITKARAEYIQGKIAYRTEDYQHAIAFFNQAKAHYVSIARDWEHQPPHHLDEAAQRLGKLIEPDSKFPLIKLT